MIPHPLNAYLESVPYSPGVHLRQLVDGLVGNSLPLATDNCTAVINEVSEGVVLQRENPVMVELLHQLLHTVICNADRGEIHIGAHKEEGKVVLKIQERNNNNGYALSFSLGALVPDVNLAGGALDVSNPRQKVITITFSFSDSRRA